MIKAEELARDAIEACLARGVEEFVLCPGSRNSPLLLEVLRRDLPCWRHFDERAAGFFALGQCRALGKPVAVITTSGTAAFELFPSMIEALYQRQPLLALTADRPKRFRGSGAPQAVEQAGMFCVYAVANFDLEEGPLDLQHWDGWGPAHVNLCLEEPAKPEEEPGEVPPLPKPASDFERLVFPSVPRRKLSPPDLVLLGALPGEQREEVRQFLETLTCPILADATSGLREEAKLSHRLLRDGEHSLPAEEIRVVLRIGGVPSARFWRDLEERPGIEVYSVLALGFRGLSRDCLMFDGLDQLEFSEGDGKGVSPSSQERAAKLDELLLKYPRSETGMVRSLSELIPDGSSLFLGNSLPVREWNLAASWTPRNQECWANRGANGIDGNLSTWLGMSARDGRETWGIFGDLTALYDLNAPWIQDQLDPAPRRIAVMNNRGGRIFRRIPSLAGMSKDVARVTESAHEVGFQSWASMWGYEHHPWNGSEDVADAPEKLVLEMLPCLEETEAFWQDWNALREGRK